MAERVRQLMEEMVPEVEEYRRRGLYSAAELRALLKRRERFELLCHGRAALRSDFLAYAQFELRLHALHALRKKRLGVRKRSVADAARVRRIHFILERACRKWKGDASLWVTWADICLKTRSNARLQRVLARALQLHPREPTFWARAASWEWEQRGSASNARALLQRGLRLLGSESADLWASYFEFELSYRLTLLRRQSALGLAAEKNPRAAAVGGARADEAQGGEEGGDEDEEEQAQRGRAEGSSGTQHAQHGGLDEIAMIAFQAALDAAPRDAAAHTDSLWAQHAASATDANAPAAARAAAIGARLLRLAAAQPRAAGLTRALCAELQARCGSQPAAALAIATLPLSVALARARRVLLLRRARTAARSKAEGGGEAAEAEEVEEAEGEEGEEGEEALDAEPPARARRSLGAGSDEDSDEAEAEAEAEAEGGADGGAEGEEGGGSLAAAARSTAAFSPPQLVAACPRRVERALLASVRQLRAALASALANAAPAPAQAAAAGSAAAADSGTGAKAPAAAAARALVLARLCCAWLRAASQWLGPGLSQQSRAALRRAAAAVGEDMAAAGVPCATAALWRVVLLLAGGGEEGGAAAAASAGSNAAGAAEAAAAAAADAFDRAVSEAAGGAPERTPADAASALAHAAADAGAHAAQLRRAVLAGLARLRATEADGASAAEGGGEAGAAAVLSERALSAAAAACAQAIGGRGGGWEGSGSESGAWQAPHPTAGALSAPLLHLAAAIAQAQQARAAASAAVRDRGGGGGSRKRGGAAAAAAGGAEPAALSGAQLRSAVEAFARQPRPPSARAGSGPLGCAALADCAMANMEAGGDGRGAAWALLLRLRAAEGAAEAELVGIVMAAHHALALASGADLAAPAAGQAVGEEGEEAEAEAEVEAEARVCGGGGGGSEAAKLELLAWALAKGSAGGSGAAPQQQLARLDRSAGGRAELCARCAAAVLALPPNSLRVFDACAQAVVAAHSEHPGYPERAAAPSAPGERGLEVAHLPPAGRAALRSVLERAVAEHPSACQPWLWLAQLEVQHGQPADVARVHWRAVRAVADAEAFSERFAALVGALE